MVQTLEQKLSLKQSLLELWMTFRPRRKIQFGLLLVLMLIGSITEALSIGAILPFLGSLTNPERIFSSIHVQPLIQILSIADTRQMQFALASMFAVMALFAGIVRLILLWANIRIGHAVGADISFDIYRKTLYRPFAIHLARNSSEIISGISTKSSQVVLCTILPILALLSSFFILVAVVLALISIDPIVAMSAFGGFGAIYVIVFRLTYGRLEANGRRYNEGVTRVLKVLQEGLGGIKDVLIDGTQET